MSYGCTDWRSMPNPKQDTADVNFAELERRYLAALSQSHPEMAKAVNDIMAQHRPPPLTKADVDGLPENLFRQGVPDSSIQLVKRMIKELGLE